MFNDRRCTDQACGAGGYGHFHSSVCPCQTPHLISHNFASFNMISSIDVHLHKSNHLQTHPGRSLLIRNKFSLQTVMIVCHIIGLMYVK